MAIFRNKIGYAPLRANLEGHWETPFDELPEELKPLVQEAFWGPRWDSLSSAFRQKRAAQWDYDHDPNLEPVTHYQLLRLEADLERWLQEARRESNDGKVVVLRDVADRVAHILRDDDRESLGIDIQELREIVSQKNALAPTSHRSLSDKLTVMNQAAEKFWSPDRVNRDDRGTHPKNAAVAGWLEEKGFSPTLADKAATIIRPEWAPTGRKPEE